MLSFLQRGVFAEPTPRQLVWFAAVGTPLALILALPPVNLWPLAFVALAPLLLLALDRSSSRVRIGWAALAAGSLYLIFVAALESQLSIQGHPWLAAVNPKLAWVVLLASVSGVALFSGLCWTAAILAISRLRERGLIIATVLGSAVWVVLEMLRTELSSGVGLGVIVGYSLPAASPFGQLASVGGVWLVSFGIIAVNLLIAEAWQRRNTTRFIPKAALLFLLAWFIVGSGLILWSTVKTRGAETVRAVAIQRSRSSTSDLGDPLTYDQLLLTDQAKQPGRSIIVLPEVSYAIDREQVQRMNGRPLQLVYPSLDVFYAASQQKLGADATLIAGFVDTTDPSGWRNGAAVVAQTGEFGTTFKRKLVQFGELLPFRNAWPVEVGNYFQYREPSRHQRIASSYGPLGVLFCNEALAPGLARADVAAGAPFIPILSSNFDVPGKPYAAAQLRAASYRAVETGRSVVLAADQTRSAILRPTGTAIAVADYASTGMIEGQIPLRRDRTLWVTFAPAWSLLLLIATIVSVILIVRPPRKQP